MKTPRISFQINALTGLHRELCSGGGRRVEAVFGLGVLVLAIVLPVGAAAQGLELNSGTAVGLPAVAEQTETLELGSTASPENDEGSLDTISLDEVQRGQAGYGLSVFEGNEIEQFSVEVLGVVEDAAPGSSYILARLSGQRLEETGVLAGMSGSPVYLDGRLAGAVAFSWAFANEPIAGITPIHEMRRLKSLPDTGSATWANGAALDGNRQLRAALSPLQVLGVERPEELDSAASLLVPATVEDLRAALSLLSPASQFDGAHSSLQLSMGGFRGRAGSILRESVAGLAESGRSDRPLGPLEAGSAVAGILVGGDLHLAFTGTVTDKSGPSVLALGHPFLGVGPVNLPMATAEVVATIPTENSSFKLSNIGPVVGRFTQDRAPGLHGVLGQLADTVPLQIEVKAEVSDSFEMEVADLPYLAPGLIATSVLQVLDTTNFSQGFQSVSVDADFQIAGHETLKVRQRLAGQGASLSSALYLLRVTDFLIRNPYEAIDVENISVRVDSTVGIDSATLLRVSADRTTVAPGETVSLTAAFKTWRGEEFEKVVTFQIPPDSKVGSYYLFVGDGPSVDSARLRIEPAPEGSLGEAIALANSFHRQDELLILGVEVGKGLVDDGHALPHLPGSIRSVIGASPVFGQKKLGLAVSTTNVVPMDLIIEGVERVDLKVVQPRGEK